jgi:hypothetical protein
MDLIRWLLKLLPLPLYFKDSGDPPKAPEPVDPSVQIAAQAKAMPSIYGPSGSRVMSGDPTAGTFRMDETLSPEQQALYEGRTGVAQQLLDRGSTSLKGLPVNYEWKGAEDPTTNRLFTEQQKLLDKSFGRQEENLDQKLSNQGLPMGSDAYDKEFSDFRQSKNDAYNKAAADSLQAGSSQSLAERQQNLNEVAQSLGGSQLTPVGQGGNPIDVSGAYAQNQAGKNTAYQGQLAGYNADVQSGNSTTTGLFGLGAAALMVF